jgi:hypothetical protein
MYALLREATELHRLLQGRVTAHLQEAVAEVAVLHTLEAQEALETLRAVRAGEAVVAQEVHHRVGVSLFHSCFY